MSLEAKKKARFKLLKALYDTSGGDQYRWMPLIDLGGHVGLDRDEALLAGEYLKGEGLLAFRAFGPMVGITHQGIREVEEALEHPDRPTEHFLPMNIVNIGTMIGSSIQQAGRQSSQVANVPEFDSSDLSKLMAEIKAEVSRKELPELTRNEVLSDVGTVEQQLASPRPKRGIIGEAMKSIRNVLEGVGAGIIANSIFDRLKRF